MKSIFQEMRSAFYSGAGKEEDPRVAALEHQLWQTLPAFCRWSSDTREGFHAIAQPLGLAMQKSCMFGHGLEGFSLARKATIDLRTDYLAAESIVTPSGTSRKTRRIELN